MATVAEKRPHDKTTKIRIRKDKDAPNGYKFDFKQFLGGTQKQKYQNDGRPGFLIDFEIDDHASSGLLFPKDIRKAMWVHPVADAQGPCPQENASWQEFTAVSVSNDGKVLTVRNTNNRCQMFKFLFNFTPDRENSEATLVPWDPIGDNRNGSQSIHLMAPAVIGSTVAVLTLAGAAVVRKKQRQTTE